VGTSICDSANRRSNRATALPSVGMNGTATRSTFDGRCVNTIVFKSPNRAPRRAAATEEAACNKPAAKKMRPSTSTLAPNFRWNQNTRNVCTMNPPPNESNANSAASLLIVPPDFRRGGLVPLRRAARAGSPWPPSTADESCAARMAHTMAMTGKTSSSRWSAGRAG